MVPVTSRGRQPADATETDLFQFLLPSLLATATWHEELRYRLYLGYDAGDPFYDSRQTRANFTAAFHEVVGDRQLELNWRRCHGTAHAPNFVWNLLFQTAYVDGCDFFYQLGDDVRLETSGWARDFPAALGLNAVVPGLGVTGPRDRTNLPPLLTFGFVSRVHMAIFGTFFSPAFRNWWADVWLTEIYRGPHLRQQHHHWLHNTSGMNPRSHVDHSERRLLAEEIARGRARLATWLKRQPAAHRPKRSRVIAFSLWNAEPRYTKGAFHNAALARKLYPGWTCRFYVGPAVPAAVVMQLAALPDVDVISVPERDEQRARLWRFLPAADEHVGVLLSRDTDRPLSEAERAAVDRWLRSDKDFHIIRDNRSNGDAIPAGAWGVRNGLLWNIRSLLATFPMRGGDRIDTDFLRACVYPAVRDQCLIHECTTG